MCGFKYFHLFQILSKEKYACMEKIKTTGSTYMAASGLTEETTYADMRHVCAVADFAFAIRDQLQYVNEHSWNNFKLRIGWSILKHTIM